MITTDARLREDLYDLIIKKYGSIGAFSAASGLSRPNLWRALSPTSKGIEPTLAVLKKIAKALDEPIVIHIKG